MRAHDGSNCVVFLTVVSTREFAKRVCRTGKIFSTKRQFLIARGKKKVLLSLLRYPLLTNYTIIRIVFLLLSIIRNRLPI